MKYLYLYWFSKIISAADSTCKCMADNASIFIVATKYIEETLNVSRNKS